MKNYRIKTKPIVDSDKYIQVKLDQTYDNLEVLSLKLGQENTYQLNSAEYGAVVGRCYMNNGLGIPNVRVAIFIPLEESDKLDQKIFEMYPYETINSVDSDFKRYTILPNEAANDCHVPIGRFPSKNQILDNPELGEVYSKYYKFTTETNDAGDYMFFGVPVGSYVVIVDCDLSDIGIFSQRPYDMVEQGSPETLFASMTQFKSDTNINLMPQIISKRVSVNVNPFWGDSENNIIGISRMDIDLGYQLEPKAIFIGSIFGDNEKNSINKNCIPRKGLGELCESVNGAGKIEMIRENINGAIETFNIDGGDLIDDNGNWAYRIPMNLDYVVTDENGELVPSEDPKVGIATRSKVRFKIGMDNSGGEGRLRTRAHYLVPHNPNNASEVDYEFGSDTKPNSFSNIYWNKIYTVKQFIPRLQKSCWGTERMCANRKYALFVKDVDGCVGSKNPFPYNRFDGDRNPIFAILCMLIRIVIAIVEVLNFVISALYNFKIPKPINWRPFKSLRCAGMECNDQVYHPGCKGDALPNSSAGRSGDATHQCYKETLAEALKIYTFNFYNDWVNGTLYSFLLKYKDRKNGARFCNVDSTDSGMGGVAINTGAELNDGSIGFEKIKRSNIPSGYIKKHTDGELYYAPYVNSTRKLFATDIYELGAVMDCDWQGKPKIHQLLVPTTYQMPPRFNEEEDTTSFAHDIGGGGLLFGFSCISFGMTLTQIRNTNRICEIGIGLDEDRPGSNKDGVIDVKDVESKYLRDCLIYLNSASYVNPSSNITSDFTGANYKRYRDLSLTNTHNLGYRMGNSLYFYFGTSSGNTSLDLMNKKFFTKCFPNVSDTITIIGNINHNTVIGGSTGGISLVIDGGTAPYIFEWSNNRTSQNNNGIPAGEYTVTVTDAMGYSVTRTFVVNEPTPLGFDYISNPALTIGGTDGSIDIQTIYGGTAPYKVVLSGAASRTLTGIGIDGVVLDNLTSGNYTVTITDASNVTFSRNIVVTNPMPLQYTLDKADNTCINGMSGEILINITSGHPPYIYSVTSTDGYEVVEENGTYSEIPYNSNDEIHTGLSKGTYTVNIKDQISLLLEAAGSSNPRRYGVTNTITITQPSGVFSAQKIRRSNGNFAIIKSQVGGVASDFTLLRNDSVTYECTDISHNGQTYVGYEFTSEPNNGNKFIIIDESGCETKPLFKTSSD